MHKKLVKSTLIVVSILLLLMVYIITAIQNNREHHNFGINQNAISCFTYYLNDYMLIKKEYPKPTYKEMILEMNNIPEIKKKLEYEDYVNHLLAKGVDAWGNPFVYTYNNDTKVLIIRSIGKNGQDENGAGDDIQRTINCKACLEMINEPNVIGQQ